jgi:hypothetical protein
MPGIRAVCLGVAICLAWNSIASAQRSQKSRNVWLDSCHARRGSVAPTFDRHKEKTCIV